MRVYVFVYVCRRVQWGVGVPMGMWRPEVDLAILHHSPPQIWRQALSLALDGICAAGWPASGFQDSTCLCPFHCESQVPCLTFYVMLRLHLRPLFCVVGRLVTETVSPQHPCPPLCFSA